MKNILNNEKGFSLIDTILGIVVASIVFGASTGALSSNVENYQNIANRKTALSDVRHALQTISDELLHIDHDDINSIGSAGILFKDTNDLNTSFRRIGATGAYSLVRGSRKLVENIEDFTVEYFDGNGNKITPLGTSNNAINLISKIRVTVKTRAINSEGSISLTTDITPRAFIGYDNFQS